MRKCTICGKVIESKTIAANGEHVYGEWYESASPDCVTKGEERRDCSYCDHYDTHELPANGHTPAQAVDENIVEVTCTTDGHYDSVVYCSVCGEELSREEKTLTKLGHDLVHHEAKAPTCTEIGWDAYDTCSRCDYSTYSELPANGHNSATAVEENRVEATCTKDGHYDSVVYCSVCGEELSREEKILTKLGHDLAHHEAKAATCTEIGWEAYDTCSRCDYSTYAELPANGHTPATAVKENIVEATCTVDGHYDSVVYCSVCGEELSREEKTLTKLGHDLVHHEAKAPTCTEIGWEEYDTCSRCDYSTYAELPANGHTPAQAVEENRVEATCTTDGHYDSVVYCSVCGEELSREEKTLTKLGHDLVHHEAKAPTCTETGWDAYDTCSRCDYSTYSELPANGHTPATAVKENIVEATCTTDGHYDSVVYCSVCGEELGREEKTLTKLGHDLVHHEAKAPTCTEIGWSEYDTCSRCDYSTYSELPVNGHTPATAVEENRVEATCTTDGHYDSVVYCSVCGEELSRETIIIPATGHEYDYENIVWNWSEDYSSATGTIKCKNDNSHTETFIAVITSQTTEATATEEGETVYTATITVNGQTYIVEKTVKIPVKDEPNEEHKSSGCGGLIGGDMGGGDGMVVGASLLISVLIVLFVSLRKKKY